METDTRWHAVKLLVTLNHLPPSTVIANNTSTKVYLPHFSGDPDNPVFELVIDKTPRISALSKDFDYFIQDDIEGFVPHPGPYWHYARICFIFSASKTCSQVTV